MLAISLRQDCKISNCADISYSTQTKFKDFSSTFKTLNFQPYTNVKGILYKASQLSLCKCHTAVI